MRVTVITMYRSSDAELFTQVVEGELTDEQKEEWATWRQRKRPMRPWNVALGRQTRTEDEEAESQQDRHKIHGAEENCAE